MKDTVLAISDVFNVLPDAVIVIDGTGQIVFANALVYGLLGYTPDELDGQDLSILIPERYRSRHTELVASFRKRHGSTPMGFRPVLHARGRSGDEIPVSIAIANIDLSGERFSVAVVRDASPVRDHLNEARLQAETDPLTNISNRLYLSRRIAAVIVANEPFGILFLDLSNFKLFNDRYGHHIGDSVLRLVAQRLQGQVRALDLVARLGGDEFVLLFEGTMENSLLADRAAAIAQSVERPFNFDRISAAIKVNIGGAIFPRDGRTESELLSVADRNMYRAKKHNVFYLP